MGIDKDIFLYLVMFALQYRYKKSPISIPIFFSVLHFPWVAGQFGFDLRPGHQLGRKKMGIDKDIFLYLVMLALQYRSKKCSISIPIFFQSCN